MGAQLENEIVLAVRRVAAGGIDFRGSVYVKVLNGPLSKDAPRALVPI